MCMMLDLPSAIETRVADYEKATGRSLRQMFLDYLLKELDRREEGHMRVQRFHELLAKKTKLAGSPYHFRRQDAYDEELA